MDRFTLRAALVVVALLLPLAAGAEPVCKADVESLCPKVPPGSGRLLVCLGQHEFKLSEPCKRRVVRLREQLTDGIKACRDDAKKLCKGVGRGGGQLAACLKEHAADLSDSCKESREKSVARVQKLLEACGDDAKKLCAEIPPGGGRIAVCLAEQEEKLSAPCSAAIDAE